MVRKINFWLDFNKSIWKLISPWSIAKCSIKMLIYYAPLWKTWPLQVNQWPTEFMSIKLQELILPLKPSHLLLETMAPPSFRMLVGSRWNPLPWANQARYDQLSWWVPSTESYAAPLSETHTLERKEIRQRLREETGEIKTMNSLYIIYLSHEKGNENTEENL